MSEKGWLGKLFLIEDQQRGARKRPFFMSKNNVSLIVNGVSYYGWLGISITTKLESITREFSVSTTTKASKRNDYSFEFDIGDFVEVKIGNDLVLTGFVTNIVEKLSNGNHEITVSGKSKTIDLVECCIPDKKPQCYKKVKVLSIIRDLAAHYDVELVEDVVKTDEIDFDVSPEEKIKEALDRLIKKYNLLLTDNPKGQLVVSLPGAKGDCKDRLTVGVNVLSSQRSRVSSPLFCRYVVLGQGTNPLSERPLEDNQLMCIVEDSSVRFRVCTRVLSGNATQAEVQSRATSLKNVSKAESNKLTYTVQGWRQSDDTLWTTNSLVMVDDDVFGIRSQFVISAAEYVLDKNGMSTTLTLTPLAKYVTTELPSTEAVVRSRALSSIGSVTESWWTKK